MDRYRKNKLVHCDDYVAGWLDSSIRDFLAMLPSNSASTAFALITCLDSNTDLQSLVKKNALFRDAMNGARPFKRGLLVPSKVLNKASVRDQLFVGFDEVFFFPTDEIEPKPDVASLVGPQRIDQAKMDQLGSWMAANACSLALGDGAGLNVIVKAHGLAKYVVGHSLLQPEPDFRMDPLWVQDEEKQPKPAKPHKVRANGRA